MNPYIPCKYVQNPYIPVQRIIYLHYFSLLYLYWSFASGQQQQKYYIKVQYITVATVARQIYFKILAGYVQLLHRQIQRLYIKIESEKEGERKRQIYTKRTIANSREPVCMCVYRRARNRKGKKERKEGKKKVCVCVRV